MSAQPQKGPLPRLPLVVPFESRGGDTAQKDPRLINAYGERLEDGTYRVLKRQGVASYLTFGALPGGYAYAYSMGSFVIQVPGRLTLLTFVAGTLGPVAHLFVAGTPVSGPAGSYVDTGFGLSFGAFPNLAVSCSSYSASRTVVNLGLGSNDVLVFNSLGALVATVATPSGALVPGLANLDDTVYVMDNTATIWGSNVGDATTWSGLNFIQALDEAGAGVYLAKHHSYVVALKSFSAEFFYDNVNPTGSPLNEVPNSTIHWGCADPYTVQVLGNQLFWLACERKGAPFIAMLDNMQPIKVSTPGIDKMLGDAAGTFTSFGFRNSSGHQHYGITSLTQGFTLVYDIGEKLWSQWNSPGSAYFPFTFAVVQPNSSTIANLLLLSSTDPTKAATLYQMDEDFTTDVAGSFGVDIYTPNTDLGTRRRKVMMRMDFLADQQPAYLQVRHSEDDFKTFSQFRQVDLNQKRPNLTNCGTFRRRAYHMHHNAPYALRLEAVELDVLLGA
jgi:hypothetical protein